jgi:hypothetical protein
MGASAPRVIERNYRFVKTKPALEFLFLLPASYAPYAGGSSPFLRRRRLAGRSGGTPFLLRPKETVSPRTPLPKENPWLDPVWGLHKGGLASAGRFISACAWSGEGLIRGYGAEKRKELTLLGAWGNFSGCQEKAAMTGVVERNYRFVNIWPALERLFLSHGGLPPTAAAALMASWAKLSGKSRHSAPVGALHLHTRILGGMGETLSSPIPPPTSAPLRRNRGSR